ncbi:HET domain containing protein [Hyaloscypha variabilis]
MAICNDCVILLEESEWVHRELLPLARSTDRCQLCCHMCNFFEIPVDLIRKGAVWPSTEEMRPPGHVLERLAVFKVMWDRETDLRRITAELRPRGSPARFPPGPRNAHLPLSWDTGNYLNSDSTLGVCMNLAGQLSKRGIWAHSGPASIASRLSTMLEFINTCDSDHPNCGNSLKDHLILPSRFIEVGSHEGNVEPRLVSSLGISPSERYTTLSHCWGANPESMPLQTTKSTESAHKRSLPMAKLPKTFRDAVNVTRALGIRYIWIDSLCIIQDDMGDWEQEAAKMASIYEGTFLTLAAVDSYNSNGGLFLETVMSPVHFEFKPRFSSGSKIAFARSLLKPRSNGDRLYLKNSPLYQRGWVFQEIMLSPRSIHFREHQMYWRCAVGLRSEDGTLDQSRENHPHLNLFDQTIRGKDGLSKSLSLNETWWGWVSDYSSRVLTKPEERIPAMTGMIRYFQRLTGDKPILGLWEESFISDLNWDFAERRTNAPLMGPSWSWLSYSGQTISSGRGYWYSREHGSEKIEPRLESFDIQWTGSPFTSRLHYSTLYIGGVVGSFKLTSPGWGEYGCQVVHPDPSWRCHSAEVHCTLDDGSEIAEGSSITCLFLFYNTDHSEYEEGDFLRRLRTRSEHFLIVSPHRPSGCSASEPIVTSDSNDMSPAAYQRVGVGYFDLEIEHKDNWCIYSKEPYNNTGRPNPPLMFDGCERVTIELV